MPGLKRAGYDLIEKNEPEKHRTLFKDGSVEITPNWGSYRGEELAIATSHPGIRDVHASCLFMGLVLISIEVASGHDFDDVRTIAEDAAERYNRASHRIAVECFGWR